MSKSNYLLILIFLFSLSCQKDNNPVDSNEVNGKDDTIDISVKESNLYVNLVFTDSTFSDLNGVPVRIEGAVSDTQKTDGSGIAWFKSIPTGNYNVFIDISYFKPYSSNIVVTDPATQLKVNLQRLYTNFNGKVVDPVGKPVSNVNVSLYLNDEYFYLSRKPKTIGNFVTDSLGSFIDSLPNGEYKIELSKENYIDATFQINIDSSTANTDLTISKKPSIDYLPLHVGNKWTYKDIYTSGDPIYVYQKFISTYRVEVISRDEAPNGFKYTLSHSKQGTKISYNYSNGIDSTQVSYEDEWLDEIVVKTDSILGGYPACRLLLNYFAIGDNWEYDWDYYIKAQNFSSFELNGTTFPSVVLRISSIIGMNFYENYEYAGDIGLVNFEYYRKIGHNEVYKRKSTLESAEILGKTTWPD